MKEKFITRQVTLTHVVLFDHVNSEKMLQSSQHFFKCALLQ